MTKQHNEDMSSVEFWRAIGIEPIVVGTSSEEDISSKASEIAERIKEAVKDINSGDKKND